MEEAVKDPIDTLLKALVFNGRVDDWTAVMALAFCSDAKYKTTILEMSYDALPIHVVDTAKRIAVTTTFTPSNQIEESDIKILKRYGWIRVVDGVITMPDVLREFMEVRAKLNPPSEREGD